MANNVSIVLFLLKKTCTTFQNNYKWKILGPVVLGPQLWSWLGILERFVSLLYYLCILLLFIDHCSTVNVIY